MFGLEPTPLTLEILTPIHIGTGETLEPLSYVGFNARRRERVQAQVEIYDLNAALQAMPSQMRWQLEGFVTRDDPAGLRAWLAPMLLQEECFAACVRRTVNASSELVEQYEREIDQPAGRLQIHPALITPVTGRPYIPGATIKGALRAAWLNQLIRTREIAPGRPGAGEFEQELLGSARQDPFRQLALSDLEFPAEVLRITRVRNVGQGGQAAGADCEAQAPGMYFEVLDANADKPPVSATGRIAWSVRPRLQAGLHANGPQALRELLSAARADAQRELQHEAEFFGAAHPAGATARRLLQTALGLGPEQTFLKLGRFGGVLSKTVPGLRAPRPRARGGRRPWGHTRFVTPDAQGQPVTPGWCRLSVGAP